MQEARQDERATKAASHFLAARRLADAMKNQPEARAGLGKALAFHIQRVAALSNELCGAGGGNLLRAQP